MQLLGSSVIPTKMAVILMVLVAVVALVDPKGLVEAMDLVVVGVKAGGTKTMRAQEGSSLVVCLLYTSPSPRDATLSRMPSSA